MVLSVRHAGISFHLRMLPFFRAVLSAAMRIELMPSSAFAVVVVVAAAAVDGDAFLVWES